MACKRSDSMWDNVTSILINLRLAACLNSFRLKHVWSRSVPHTFIVVVEFAPDTEDLQTSRTGHTEKNKEALQISVPRNKGRQAKRLGNGKEKSSLHCTWLKSCSRGSGMWWQVLGSSGRIQAPDPFNLKLPAEDRSSCSAPSRSSGSSPSLPVTDGPRVSDFSQQHRQHRKKEKKLFGFSSCGWCHILTLSLLCVCACTWVCVWRTYKLKE